MENIRIELTASPKEKPNIDPLPFGKYFSDHMFLMNYEAGKGWFDPRIVPYGPFTLDPSCMVFHYAQEIFEGLKAYRRADGSIPADNFRRMNDSARRMCIPEVDVDFCVEALKKLVTIERDWVPTQEAASLYIRPFIIATDCNVGVHASKTYIFCIILSPSGNYYPEGLDPVKIAIEDEDVRAVRGGTGFTKCGGNYAASIRAGERAADRGYSQVLWLDGVHRKYIEEVGSMNIMFKIDGTVVTPVLQGFRAASFPASRGAAYSRSAATGVFPLRRGSSASTRYLRPPRTDVWKRCGARALPPSSPPSVRSNTRARASRLAEAASESSLRSFTTSLPASSGAPVPT